MFKTNALNSVANAFVNKNVGTGTPGTRLEADDRNIVQDEIVNAVEDDGQTLDASGIFTNNDQLATAISLFYSNKKDYAVGRIAIGSDNNLYKCLIVNGPGSTIVNPVGDTTGTWDIANIDGYNGIAVRGKFLWKDSDEIYLNAGSYYHDGTAIQTVYWDSKLTFQLGPTGSNSGSDTLGNDQWHYIYLDDSAIATSGSRVITASELINKTTAPAWSNSKHGWYDGNDRCIFAVRTDGSANILEFFNSGDAVFFADDINNLSGANTGTTWTDATLTIPAFATKATASFALNMYSGLVNTIYWRTNGQTGTSGHNVVTYDRTGIGGIATTIAVADCITDTSQIVEVKLQTLQSTPDTIDVNTCAWHLPDGM